MLTQQSANRKDLNAASNGVELQHRHFAFIAGVIAKMRDVAMRDDSAIIFANACMSTNKNFNRARFLAACNYGKQD